MTHYFPNRRLSDLHRPHGADDGSLYRNKEAQRGEIPSLHYKRAFPFSEAILKNGADQENANQDLESFHPKISEQPGPEPSAGNGSGNIVQTNLPSDMLPENDKPCGPT